MIFELMENMAVKHMAVKTILTCFYNVKLELQKGKFAWSNKSQADY